MHKLDSVVYTGIATVTGGRAGKAESDDGRLQTDLSVPKELGGDSGPGTNPEQMFAAGYAACFIGALGFVAAQQKVKLPANVKVTGEVGIGPIATGFAIKVKLIVDLGDTDTDKEALVAKAHEVCPYSNATRGNIEVTFEVL
ncbi:organic hydroperoxide resistance protein [Alteromonas lipolytica]|uniref:Organic hydroperoxide resistance protein n=1 Tax=Alteromonas lipolytica TaxID=1856405 RepID=A0A1E8FD59_9ALTE|nr:organic hydroperoxide resistance protein [Alteromonas lipolytica]OFI33877.1 organic hydroperoxide resistance protein [Alteromonas lipolytica]GGF67582.1 organic hydroperoxide resistance protein [Alteromonas lipolytica]